MKNMYDENIEVERNDNPIINMKKLRKPKIKFNFKENHKNNKKKINKKKEKEKETENIIENIELNNTFKKNNDNGGGELDALDDNIKKYELFESNISNNMNSYEKIDYYNDSNISYKNNDLMQTNNKFNKNMEDKELINNNEFNIKNNEFPNKSAINESNDKELKNTTSNRDLFTVNFNDNELYYKNYKNPEKLKEKKIKIKIIFKILNKWHEIINNYLLGKTKKINIKKLISDFNNNYIKFNYKEIEVISNLSYLKEEISINLYKFVKQKYFDKPTIPKKKKIKKPKIFKNLNFGNLLYYKNKNKFTESQVIFLQIKNLEDDIINLSKLKSKINNLVDKNILIKKIKENKIKVKLLYEVYKKTKDINYNLDKIHLKQKRYRSINKNIKKIKSNNPKIAKIKLQKKSIKKSFKLY